MKKFLLFFLSLNFSGSFAVIRTVSNDINIPAQFTTFDAAYTASAPGDTIYLHGSSTNYIVAGSVIAKAITIIGPGFNPDKQYKLPASFSGNVSIGVSNVHIFGINNKNFSFALAFGITNCTISRCYFNNINMTATNTNILIEGCCWQTGTVFFFSGLNNTLINCVINRLVFSAGTQNCTIDHNTILAFSIDFSNLTNSWVSNNIFYLGVATNPANNNSFNNNLSAFGPIVLPGTGNVGAANIQGTALFTDYVAPRPFFYYNNLTLTVASPGKNISTDGTDAGATGGGNPFASEGEVKTIPIIREMDIMTPIVPSPGNINVHIRATQPK